MTSRLERIAKQRLDKLERIRAQGINPYPHTYHRTHTAQEAIALLKQYEDSGQTGAPIVTVAGRITARRNMGKISFMDLRDGSGKIQVLMGDLLNANQLQLLKDIDIGDSGSGSAPGSGS